MKERPAAGAVVHLVFPLRLEMACPKITSVRAAESNGLESCNKF